MKQLQLSVKTLLALLLFISTAVVFNSCLKEQDILQESKPIADNSQLLTPTTDEELIQTNIFGTVVNENDAPFSGIQVSLKTTKAWEVTYTDENGNFSYSNVLVEKNGAFLRTYHWNDVAFRKMSITSNSYNYTKIKLLHKKVIGEVPSTEGGILEHESTAKLQLAPNSVGFKYGGGDYTGNVQVLMSWIDPTAEDLTERMIGDLSGIDASGKEVILGTFGMLTVQLQDENYNPLQIKEGSHATLYFPVPAEIREQAPAEIPLWSYDETLGTWIEEGSATLQDGFYVGEVGHFSSWNVDWKGESISVSGEVFTRIEGQDYPLPYLQVYVDVEGIQQVGGFLDDSGAFEFYNFPANKVFTLSILDACGGILWQEELGPYSDNTELETIVIQSPDVNFVAISGSGIDCSENPVEQGFVDFEMNGLSSFYPLKNEGTFDFLVNTCAETEGNLKLIDSKNGKGSNTQTVDLLTNTVLLPSLEVCNEFNSFMRIQMNDSGWDLDVYLSESRALLKTNNLLSIEGIDNNFFALLDWSQPVEGVGVYQDVDLIVIDWDVGFEYTVTVEITEYEENVGEVIIGTFYQEQINSETGEVTNLVTGSFKAIRE